MLLASKPLLGGIGHSLATHLIPTFIKGIAVHTELPAAVVGSVAKLSQMLPKGAGLDKSNGVALTFLQEPQPLLTGTSTGDLGRQTDNKSEIKKFHICKCKFWGRMFT